MKDIDSAIKMSQKAERYKMIKLYFVPLFGFVSFMGIILLLVLPKITQLFSLVEETSNLTTQIEQKDTVIAGLNNLKLNSAQVNGQLSTINSIIPPGTTEVVSFRDRITDIAETNGLTIDAQRLSEVVDANIIDAQAEVQNYIGTLGLQEVPSVFQVSGTFTEIDRFVRALDTLEDFIVVKEMKLNLKDEVNADLNNLALQEWTLEIQLVKYQFANSNNNEEIQKIYLNIPSTAKPEQNVLDYLDRKN